jgi:ArsR family transcriptional regulator
VGRPCSHDGRHRDRPAITFVERIGETGEHIATNHASTIAPLGPCRRLTATGRSGYRKKTMKLAARATEPCCPPAEEQPDRRPVEGDAADEELATLAKALGHPARVKIVRILLRKNACICGDIVDELPLAQSTVSQHLKVLKDAGLIRGDVDGPRVCYCIEPRARRRVRARGGAV